MDPKPQRTPPRSAKDLLAGALVDGRYRVIKKLGSGGTSTVYEVEQTRTGGRLALKLLLDPLLAPRLEQEARSTAKLKSHHIAHALDFGNDRGTPYMVMPLLVGQSLRMLLAERPKLDLRTTANVVLQLAECLDEAHKLNLVHRDLKPENIHLSAPSEGESPAATLFHLTLLDFGVVKVAQSKDTSQLTRTGSTVGTPYYMSLEQLRGASDVDARADIYSMSVMLYECLAGVIPFTAATLGDLVFAICAAPPLALDAARPELPKDIVDIVMQGLASMPDKRPGSVRDIARVFLPHADPAYSLWLRGGAGEGAPAAEAQTPRPPTAAALASTPVSGAPAISLAAVSPPAPSTTAGPPPALTPPPAEGPVFGGAAAKNRAPAPTGLARKPPPPPSAVDQTDAPTDDDGPTRNGVVPASIAMLARGSALGPRGTLGPTASPMPPPGAAPASNEPPKPLAPVGGPPRPATPAWPAARDRDTPTEMFSPASALRGPGEAPSPRPFVPPPAPSQRSLDPADATAVLSLPLVASFPERPGEAQQPPPAPIENDTTDSSEVEDHPTDRPENAATAAPEFPPMAPPPSFAPAIPMGPPPGANYPSGAWPTPFAATGPHPAAFAPTQLPGQGAPGVFPPPMPPGSPLAQVPPSSVVPAPPPMGPAMGVGAGAATGLGAMGAPMGAMPGTPASFAQGAPASSAAPRPRGGEGLDQFLAKLGAEGRKGVVRFRAATPGQQAAVVAISAALSAVVLVLFVFLLIRC